LNKTAIVDSAQLTDLLPANGRVLAVVVGIEKYQASRFDAVRFAEADGRAFAQVLDEMYGRDLVDCELLVNELATKATLDYQIGQAIDAAGPDDLLLFFYAGHGFFGAGDNYLTAFDTGTASIMDTSVPILGQLIQPLSASKCRRALLFVDACATKVPGRAPISTFNEEAVRLPGGNADDYHALFLSCQRGQSSYPALAEHHGIWTFHLLKALRGDADAAIVGENLVTDVSLRDYLRDAVPKYIREKTKISNRQVPEALIRASSTFVIRSLPQLPIVTGRRDLSMLAAPVRDVYFEGSREGSVKNLSGFNKKAHRVPSGHSAATNQFVKKTAWSEIKDDLSEVYQRVKDVFGLRRSEITKDDSEGDASGSIDCEYFRYSVEAEQNPNEDGEFRIVRQLVLRESDQRVVDRCQRVFGTRVNRLVIEVGSSQWDYDELVSRFEQFEQNLGGDLQEDDDTGIIRYEAEDGETLQIEVYEGRILLSTRHSTIPDLLDKARAVTFGLTGSNMLSLQ